MFSEKKTMVLVDTCNKVLGRRERTWNYYHYQLLENTYQNIEEQRRAKQGWVGTGKWIGNTLHKLENITQTTLNGTFRALGKEDA